MKKLLLLFLLPFLFSCTPNPLTHFQVHILSLPSGESILLEIDHEYILINTGSEESYSVLTDYLDTLKIKDLRYLITTEHQSGYDDNTIALSRDYSVHQLISMNEYDYPTRKVEEQEKIYLDALVLTFYPTKRNSTDVDENVMNIEVQYKNHHFLFLYNSIVELLPKKIDVLVLNPTSVVNENVSNYIQPNLVVMNDTRSTPIGKKTEELLSLFQCKYYQTSIHGNTLIQSDGKSLFVKVEND